MRKNLLIILSLTFLVFACKKDELSLEELSRDQEILFQVEYLNHAWGFSHHGFIIDTAGLIYTYDKPENWIFPDSTGRLTALEMRHNLSKASLSSVKIDRKVLKEKSLLINAAANGKLSDPESVMADAGTFTYYTFVFNKEVKEYKQVLLHQTGDWTIRNSSDEAENLYKWLESVMVKN